MKVKMQSMFLAIFMILSVCLLPAFAAESSPELTLVPVSKPVPVDAMVEDDAFEITSAEDMQNERLSTTDIRDSVHIRQVVIYPIVYCVEETAFYRITDIYRVQNWTGLSATDQSLKLNPDQVTAFVNQVLTALQSNTTTSGKTWQIAGWTVVTTHQLTANKPLRVEYKPCNLCVTGTDKITVKVTGQSEILTRSHDYGLPEDPTGYYYLGITGAFYSRYISGPNAGQENGLMMGGGVRMNTLIDSVS